ncbi:hypothetical protein NPIL_663721 [Nephila pilipes]|uniref:Uncharacterized protein n=1 Tax=Nephila pilipes TaxID=299642 RepID=A0A8X6QU35_NEPPI|nr:hypothetical protein NPIL_663721 [Nephila pilipes]
MASTFAAVHNVERQLVFTSLTAHCRTFPTIVIQFILTVLCLSTPTPHYNISHIMESSHHTTITLSTTDPENRIPSFQFILEMTAIGDAAGNYPHRKKSINSYASLMLTDPRKNSEKKLSWKNW